jgi:hypothetical protein
VVVWHVGEVDVRLGQVQMEFRVTLFWDDRTTTTNQQGSPKRSQSWTMQGRQHAFPQESSSTSHNQLVDVPPLSILNAASFDVIGSPEIAVIGADKDSKFMRWTCMYRAILVQGDMRVDNFPHDQHNIVIKLGILAHRNKCHRWDKSNWSLQLATESDSKGSTRIPHGLLVEHAFIPGFTFNKTNGLVFEFVDHEVGSLEQRDQSLQVKLTVFRDSGHYDRNIMPLMGMLNIVAITCVPRHFAPNTGSIEQLLGIAFVEIGFRLVIDNQLPSVGYQIKMQRIMNECFWLLMCLAIECNICYILVEFRGWPRHSVVWIDLVVGIIALGQTSSMLLRYYGDMIAQQQKLHEALKVQSS